MLHTFEGWFCSTKLLDFPFFAIALFCTVQFWEYCVSSCVSVIYETLKHFHMNSVVRQMWEQNTDVVMVDTGNSYEGLCEYVGGKYISYTEEHPITMNPFRIKREELNVEKTGFLKNLIMLIWKGTQGTVTKTEERLYDVYFNGFNGFTPPQREDLRKGLLIDDRNKNVNSRETENERMARIEAQIDEIESRRKQLPVTELSFNSFYESVCSVFPTSVRKTRFRASTSVPIAI